jgi:hypothetical protein
MSSLADELELMQSLYPEMEFSGADIKFKFEQDFVITLHIPTEYPHCVPSLQLCVPWINKEKEKIIAEKSLQSVQLGDPMLFDIVSWIRENVPEPPPPPQNYDILFNPQLVTSDKDLAFGPRNVPKPKPKPEAQPVIAHPEEEEAKTLEGFIVSETLTDRKSAFQAHLARVETLEEVRRRLSEARSNRKLSKATHNMWAFKLDTGELQCEDDGVGSI